MADLTNEVKFDFSGAAALVGNLQRAQRYSSLINKDITDAMKAAQSARQALQLSRMPGGATSPAGGPGMSAAAQFATFAGSAAAGSAFFYHSTGLANPQAMQRFHDALDDTAAVIGHELVPALKQMTIWVRQFGDYLANHPTQTKVIAGGVLGATAIGLAGTAFAVGRSAYSGVKAGVGLVGRAFGYGGGGASAAGGSARAAQAAAAVGAMRSEGELMQLAQSARGRAASGEIGAATEASAIEGELAALRAARAAPPVAATGRFARFGQIGLRGARIAGRFSEFAGPSLTVADVASARTFEEAIGKTDITGGSDRFYRQMVGPRTRAAVERNYGPARELGQEMIGANSFKRAFGFSPNPFDWFGSSSSGGKGGIIGGALGPALEKSSFGAAARPANYQDILGSIMAMRQSIIQGGRDPNEDIAANTETTAKGVTELVRIAQKNEGGDTDRGTSGR